MLRSQRIHQTMQQTSQAQIGKNMVLVEEKPNPNKVKALQMQGLPQKAVIQKYIQ
uniref:Mez1 n=1 Tax=Arundo donax TaxID=35708 RepID=A0A0A9DRP0_ARUDO